METMTISKAVDILAPLLRTKSVDSDVAYLFTIFVNDGKTPEKATSPMNTEKRKWNLAISYAKEYLEKGMVTAA